MSRQRREAELEALYGGDLGLTLITERGGRKRDKRKILEKRMGELMAAPSSPSTNVNQVSDAPTVLGSYQSGSMSPPPDYLAQMLAGVDTTDELYEQGAQEYPGLAAGGLDKPAHAMWSERMTERMGAPLATATGFWREAMTGAANKLARGGDFFGPRGFDWADMAANYQGIDRGKR